MKNFHPKRPEPQNHVSEAIVVFKSFMQQRALVCRALRFAAAVFLASSEALHDWVRMTLNHLVTLVMNTYYL